MDNCCSVQHILVPQLLIFNRKLINDLSWDKGSNGNWRRNKVQYLHINSNQQR